MKKVPILKQNFMLDIVRNNSAVTLYEDAKRSIEQGQRDPLDLFQMFKMFSDTYNKLNDDDAFKGIVMDNAAKHITSSHNEQNPAIYNGFKMYFSKNVQTDFNNDYALINLKTKQKERETYLKSLQQTIFDELTGEVLAEPPTYRTKKILICTKK